MGEETDSKKRKSKKEKRVHKDLEVESDLLENDKQTKKKKKQKIIDSEAEQTNNSEVESHEKDKKRKRKDKSRNDTTEEVLVTKKHKKDCDKEDSLQEDNGLNKEPPTKKLKKKKQQDIDENSSKPASHKKKKKDKGNSNSNIQASLGVVDESVLNQASTNLGLPVEDDNLETNSKPKKKKDKSKAKTEVEETPPEKEGTRWSRCLTYLKQWSSDRDNWRFKKASQIHLLNIMYDKEQMIDEDFTIMLQYLEELKGKGREKTKDDAEKLLKDDTDDDESKDSVKVERARQIYQLLN